MKTLEKLLRKFKEVIRFIIKTLDTFVLLFVLSAIWYVFGSFTKYYDPTQEMNVWTPMVPILFASIVVIISVLLALIIIAIAFPNSYRIIINALDNNKDLEESGLSKKETWYVSLFLFCFFVLMFVLSVKIL